MSFRRPWYEREGMPPTYDEWVWDQLESYADPNDAALRAVFEATTVAASARFLYAWHEFLHQLAVALGLPTREDAQ